MDSQDLRNLLENSSNKLNVFEDKTILSQYSLTVRELLDCITNFLDDTQKAKLFELEHFKNLGAHIKSCIFVSMSNDAIKLDLLQNADFVNDLPDHQIVSIIESLTYSGRMQILHNTDFLKKHNIKGYQLKDLIKSLDEESKQDLLSKCDFVKNDLCLGDFQVKELVASIDSEEAILQMIDLYSFKPYEVADIIAKGFSDKSKIAVLLENKYGFRCSDLTSLLSSLSTNSLLDFFRNNKDYLSQNNTSPYHVTKGLTKEKQVEFVSKFEDSGLTLGEKRQILATLEQEAKSQIDTSDFPEEYITAINMPIDNNLKNIRTFGKIIVDFNGSLERYRDLDELLYINPMHLSNDDKAKMFQLLEICPKLEINDDKNIGSSTAEEYLNAEAWIETVMQGINPEWTKVQKIAYIDNAIGKKISYSPDFETESGDENDARALWKIIDSGYGVCNGIAQVEQYILGNVGIETEMVSSDTHAFLLVRNLEVTTANGQTINGDTILDPTWNLLAHKYGAKPNNFCRSYSEIRKHDIDDNGIDRKCHKNDEGLQGATLDIDAQTLRQVFTSIGIADKDGIFPIKDQFYMYM